MKRNELLQQTAQEARRYRLIRLMSETDSLLTQLGAKGPNAASRIQSLELPERLRADLHDLRELRNRLAHEDDDHRIQEFELSQAEGEAQQSISSLCMMLWMNGKTPRIRQAHQPGRQTLMRQAKEMGLSLGISRHEQRTEEIRAEIKLWSEPGPQRQAAQNQARKEWLAHQWTLIRKSPLGPYSPLRGPFMQALPLSLMAAHLMIASSWLQGLEDSRIGLIPSLVGTGNATLHLMVVIGLLSGVISQGLKGRIPGLLALWLGHLLISPTPGIIMLELFTAASLMLRAETPAATRQPLLTPGQRARKAMVELEREVGHGERLRQLQAEMSPSHSENQKTSTDGRQDPSACPTAPTII